MSAPGCCRHCEPDLCVSTTHFPPEHWTANWETDHCPACAEAARIADELRRLGIDIHTWQTDYAAQHTMTVPLADEPPLYDTLRRIAANHQPEDTP